MLLRVSGVPFVPADIISGREQLAEPRAAESCHGRGNPKAGNSRLTRDGETLHYVIGNTAKAGGRSLERTAVLLWGAL